MSASVLAFPGRRVFRKELPSIEMVPCKATDPGACLPDTEENEPWPKPELWEDPPADPLSMVRYFRRIVGS